MSMEDAYKLQLPLTMKKVHRDSPRIRRCRRTTNNHVQSPNRPQRVGSAPSGVSNEEVAAKTRTHSSPQPTPAPVASASAEIDSSLPASSSPSKSPSGACTRLSEDSSLPSIPQSNQNQHVDGPGAIIDFPCRSNIEKVEEEVKGRVGVVWVPSPGPGDRPPTSWGAGSRNGNACLDDDDDNDEDADIISLEKTSLSRADTTEVDSSVFARTSLCDYLFDINESNHNKAEGNNVVQEVKNSLPTETISEDGTKNQATSVERTSVLATCSLPKNGEENDNDNSEWINISDRKETVRASVLETFQQQSKEEIETLPQAELIRASMRGHRASSSFFIDSSGLLDSFHDWVEASFSLIPLATPIGESAIRGSLPLTQIIEEEEGDKIAISEKDEEEGKNEITGVPRQRPRLERGAGKTRHLSLDHLLTDWEEKENSLYVSGSTSSFFVRRPKKLEEHFRNLIEDFSRKRKRDDDLVDMLQEVFLGRISVER